jgi:hypothetical protein
LSELELLYCDFLLMLFVDQILPFAFRLNQKRWEDIKTEFVLGRFLILGPKYYLFRKFGFFLPASEFSVVEEQQYYQTLSEASSFRLVLLASRYL